MLLTCICVAGFMIFMYIFETYLDIRQHRALKLPTLPKPLLGVISDEKFERSRAYSLDKRFVQDTTLMFLVATFILKSFLIRDAGSISCLAYLDD